MKKKEDFLYGIKYYIEWTFLLRSVDVEIHTLYLFIGLRDICLKYNHEKSSLNKISGISTPLSVYNR